MANSRDRFPLYSVLTDAYTGNYAARSFSPDHLSTTEVYLPDPKRIAAVTALHVTRHGSRTDLRSGFATGFNYRTGLPDYDALVTEYGMTVGRVQESARRSYPEDQLAKLIGSYTRRVLVGTAIMGRSLAVAHIISDEGDNGLQSTLVYHTSIATGDPEKMTQIARQQRQQGLPTDGVRMETYEKVDAQIGVVSRVVDACVTFIMPNVLNLQFMASDFYAPEEMM